MKFTQEIQKKVKVKIEPKFMIWDFVYMENEVWTILVSKVDSIKVSDWKCYYGVSFCYSNSCLYDEKDLNKYE
jgi:hypothetical protein